MFRTISVVSSLGVAILCAQTPATVPNYATPDEARLALVHAAEGGMTSLRDVFGVGADKVLKTGDSILDESLVKNFKRRISEKTGIEMDRMNSNRATLLLGAEEWPFAVPLVRKDNRWRFDLKEGEAELRRRIIGGNELDAIEVCQGFFEAQLKYSEVDRNGDGLVEFASRIISSPGAKDGLYWPGPDSPVAEPFAKAIAEGYTPGIISRRPYHGYYYKMLPRQGANAEGGAREYKIRGFYIGGFALIAWPVEYGNSGFKTFLVNQRGVVYEKDLGPKTGTIAAAMTAFNPDKTWGLAPEVVSGDE